MNDRRPVEIHLPAGHFHFGGGNVRVNTLLGTCIAIAIWHPVKRLGGICHFLLPARRPNVEVDDVLPGLFAADVMGLFNRAVLACATRPEEYVVKVAGGGNMFPAHLMPAACRVEGCTDKRRASCPSVGCKNVSAARGLLTGSGYSIASESVGGLGSRKVLFDLGTGDLWVKRGSAISASIQANA